MDRKPFLPYGRQWIDDDDVAAVAEALRSDFLTTGPRVEAFEAAVAEAVGARHAVAVSSGTAALHVACLAAGCGPGQAWVVPSVSFVATANAVRYCGAEVVFADVDPDTGLMRPEDLEAALARAEAGRAAVAGVLPVYMGGQVDRPWAVAELAARRGLWVIEDAAHALGSRYTDPAGRERRVGAAPGIHMSAFSTHPVKTMTTGEGGIVTTGDAALAERLRRMRAHGLTRDPADFRQPDLAFAPDGTPNPWYYELPELGFNYRITDLQCALGLSQLAKLERFAARRRDLRACYEARLAPLAPSVTMVPQRGAQAPAWHLAVALIDFAGLGIARARLMAELREAGIGSQVHYIPIHLQPYYRARYGRLALPGATSYYERCLSLPLFYGLAAEDVDCVVDALAEALASREAAAG